MSDPVALDESPTRLEEVETSQKQRAASPTLCLLKLEQDETVKKYNKELELENKLRAIRMERAQVDQDEDDTQEERDEREAAWVVLSEYSGDEFTACRQDEREVLRAFFLVNGSQAMLALRSKSKNQGGCTLLHTCAFWGSESCVKFLLGMGADVNALDSCVSRSTPLLEAGRAGHVGTCKKLLAEGANIRDQDMFGDTVFHFCARAGRGGMIPHLKSCAEKYRPGSTSGVLDILNLKGRKCIDVAANESVRAIIGRIQEDDQNAKQAVSQRFRKSIAKGKIIGGQISNAQQNRRKGRFNQKKK